MEAVGLVPLYCQDDIVLYKFVQLVATSTVLVTSCFFQVRFGDGNGSWDKPIVSALESVPTMADLKMRMLVPTPMETTHRRSQRHGRYRNMLLLDFGYRSFFKDRTKNWVYTCRISQVIRNSSQTNRFRFPFWTNTLWFWEFEFFLSARWKETTSEQVSRWSLALRLWRPGGSEENLDILTPFHANNGDPKFALHLFKYMYLYFW